MRHCEECWAVLDPAKVLRCTKCKACFYCSRACQSQNWKRIHKRVCSTDPALRPFIRVEMAVERVLKKLPKMEEAPKDAFCYICLEGEEGGKLMRGCACRGDSAGFVHIECLAKLAVSKEDAQAVYTSWTKCGNCKQGFEGALMVEMDRRFWRHYRSSQDLELRYNSTKTLAISLGFRGEVDATNQLLDAASKCVRTTEALLDLKLHRIEMLIQNGHYLEALGLLQAMLPEAKADTATPYLYEGTMQELAGVLLHLNRNQEAHEIATELVALAKAKFGREDRACLGAMGAYAITCAKLGRVEEGKGILEDVLTIETRVLGREHPQTQRTRRLICSYASQCPPDEERRTTL